MVLFQSNYEISIYQIVPGVYQDITLLRQGSICSGIAMHPVGRQRSSLTEQGWTGHSHHGHGHGQKPEQPGRKSRRNDRPDSLPISTTNLSISWFTMLAGKLLSPLYSRRDCSSSSVKPAR